MDLQHIQKGRLAGIGETKEEKFSFFLHEAKVGENVIEPTMACVSGTKIQTGYPKRNIFLLGRKKSSRTCI